MSARPLRRSAAFLAKDLGGLALYYPVAELVARAPRSALVALSRAGGRAKAGIGQQAEAREELRRLFGSQPLPASEEEILRRAAQLALMNELEVLRYPHLTPASIGDTAEVVGLEHLAAARAAGRGAIVALMHFGANQMVMPALGHLGYPMSQLSAPPTVWADLLREERGTPLWEKVLARRWALEQRLPVKHINVFRFLRPAFEALSRNELLGLAFDGGGGSGWAPVQLLARRAWLSTQPARIWQRSGAAVVPAVVLRQPGEARHRVLLQAPLAWQGGRGEAEANLQRLVDRFTPLIAAHPEQYLPFLMLRRRMRGRDLRPFFDDYPPASQVLSPAEAEARLRAAGQRSAS